MVRARRDPLDDFLLKKRGIVEGGPRKILNDLRSEESANGGEILVRCGSGAKSDKVHLVAHDPT
jgi:hypothetical protein